MTKIVFQGVCNVYHDNFNCKWKPLLDWVWLKGNILRKKLSHRIPGNVLVLYVWPPFLWSCTFLSMVLKDKKRTYFRINLYFDSFLYSPRPGWFTICVSEAELCHFPIQCHKWVSWCSWIQSFSPARVVCSCCPKPPLTQGRGFICSQSHKESWAHLKTSALFSQPHWW